MGYALQPVTFWELRVKFKQSLVKSRVGVELDDGFHERRCLGINANLLNFGTAMFCSTEITKGTCVQSRLAPSNLAMVVTTSTEWHS